MTKQDVIRDIQKVAKGDGLVTITEISQWWGASVQTLSRKLRHLPHGCKGILFPM